MPARMNRSCYSRILGRTYSAPDIIERILDGRPPFGLPQLLRDFPSSERRQRQKLAGRDYAAMQVDSTQPGTGCADGPLLR
jgi:hypothetical protein